MPFTGDGQFKIPDLAGLPPDLGIRCNGGDGGDKCKHCPLKAAMEQRIESAGAIGGMSASEMQSRMVEISLLASLAGTRQFSISDVIFARSVLEDMAGISCEGPVVRPLFTTKVFGWVIKFVGFEYCTHPGIDPATKDRYRKFLWLTRTTYNSGG